VSGALPDAASQDHHSAPFKDLMDSRN